MKTGILFDLDGTLLDTLEDLTDATNYALRQMTLALPGRENDPSPEQLLAVYKPYYEGHCQIKTAPYPGVLAALTAVAQRYPVAIVSNKPDAAVKALCAEHFPGIYALGETPDCPRKPAPDMVHKAMAQMGVDACVFVGDSEVDILTAKNAGVPCLSVLWGFRDREQLENAGGKYFCENAESLPEMVDKIIGEYHGK